MAGRKLSKQLPEYTSRGCTLTKNNSKWCFRICEPDSEGIGHCGRIAPHSIESYLQKCIRQHNEKIANRVHTEKAV